MSHHYINPTMKQQKILGEFGLPVRDMDIDATANSYVKSIKALQELNRAMNGENVRRLQEAKAEAKALIRGAGFSL